MSRFEIHFSITDSFKFYEATTVDVKKEDIEESFANVSIKFFLDVRSLFFLTDFDEYSLVFSNISDQTENFPLCFLPLGVSIYKK